MGVNKIDTKLFAKAFIAGAKNLESKKEWINELNVFPVPDGDTGTNMTMTIMSAAKDVADKGLAFLDTRSIGRRNMDHIVVSVHFAGILPYQCNGRNALFPAGIQGLYKILRIAGSGNAHKNVSFLSVCNYLPCKNLIKTEIVADSREDGSIHRKRYCRKAGAV